MKKSFILLLIALVNFGLFSCTKTDLADEVYPIQACCGDDGDIPPPPPPPPGGDQ